MKPVFFKKKYVSISLERLFWNSNMVGIHFILFSRLSLKALSLREIKELLQPITAEQLCVLLSQNINLYNTKIEARNFDDMDGYQFEKFCAKILCENGFESVEVTQGSGDHGIDIVAEKDDITYAIQCKCYSSNIGNAAVQQVYTDKGFYNKDIAVVMTNRYFTLQAIEEANTLGVKLWDRNKLSEMAGGQKYLDSENIYKISNGSSEENEVLRQYNENRGEGELRILSIEEKIVAIEDGNISRYLYQYLEEASRIAVDMYLENGDGNSYTEDMIRCVERPKSATTSV